MATVQEYVTTLTVHSEEPKWRVVYCVERGCMESDQLAEGFREEEYVTVTRLK